MTGGFFLLNLKKTINTCFVGIQLQLRVFKSRSLQNLGKHIQRALMIAPVIAMYDHDTYIHVSASLA